MNKYETFFFRLLLFLTVIITLYPFFKIGFTTGDDLEYYMTYLTGDFLYNAKVYAEGAGRFYFLITKPIYSLPYIFDNFYVTKCIQYISVLITFSLFSYLIKKIFHSKWLALLSFLFLILPLSVMPNYFVPIMAYPLFFSLSLSLALVAFILLLRYYETGKNKYLALSVVVYFVVMLFYETYLIFLGAILLFIFIRNIRKNGLKMSFRNRDFYKEMVPFISIGCIYILAYFSFRAFIQTPDGFYDGSSFAKSFSIPHFFQILFRFNNAALPTKIYHLTQNVIQANSLLPQGHQPHFLYVLTHSSVQSVVNAVIQVVLFIYIILHIKTEISWKKIGSALIISFLLMISSHLLVAIADKYNSTYYFMNGYVTTFYSYFAVTLLLVILFYAFYKIMRKREWSRYIGLIAMGGVLFYVSIITGYTNEHLSRDWERSQNRFTVVDDLIKNHAFDSIPENAIVYAPDLHETSSLLGKGVTLQNFGWQHYIHAKTGKSLDMAQRPEECKQRLEQNPDRPVYRIVKKESIKRNDLFLVISQVDIRSIRWEDEKPFQNAVCTDHASLHYYSPAKEFNLLYNSFREDTVRQTSVPEHIYYVNATETRPKVASWGMAAPGALVESFTISELMPYMAKDSIILK